MTHPIGTPPDLSNLTFFAKLDRANVVVQVLSIDQEQINTGAFGHPELFVQTCRYTRGNVHSLGGTPLRKNAAGIGYIYDRELDIFIEPNPFPSWRFDRDKGQWFPPVPYPDDYDEIDYEWNEDAQAWELVPGQLVVIA
jgi:hypothetical protein